MGDVEACRQEIQRLNGEIDELKGDCTRHLLQEYNEKNGKFPDGKYRIYPTAELKARRALKGHFGKIYALQWSEDSRHLVSASQDGKLFIWNGFSTNKIQAIPLRSSWVMTCAYSPNGDFVACGGLDNLCSVYKLNGGAPGAQKTHAELAQHEGYLSCARFVTDNEMLTCSGDSTCILWDVETRSPKAVFNHHISDVMSLSVHGDNGVFVSGSCDAVAKLWDYRAGLAPVANFTGHESDINSVQIASNGVTIATGSDDSTVKVFDTRARVQLGTYGDDKILCGITSVAFTKSGKFIYAGYDDFTVYGWEVGSGTMCDQLLGHTNRVSCLDITKDGKALCTGSWDASLKIWS